MESLPPAQREVVWNFVEPEIEGDVLVELSDDVRQSFIEGMDADELLAAAENMELDDLADLVGDLPEAVSLQLVKSMDQQDRERLKTVLAFEHDTAGGLMNTDTVSVRADVTVEVVLRYLRMRAELPDKTDRLFVVDRDDRYMGTVALTRLLTEDAEKSVGDILDAQASRISPETIAHDVVQLFQDRDLVSAAVVDDRASCWAASRSTTWWTSSARKPRMKSCPRPACVTKKTCSPASSHRRAAAWCGWESTW